MPSPLTVDIRPIQSLSADEQAQWNLWVAADPDQTSPFFRVEYALIVDGVCPHSALAVFRRDTEVVGYFPYQQRGGTVQPLGAPLNDYHGVIGPFDSRPSLDEVARHLNVPCIGVTAWIGEGQGLEQNPSYRAVIPQGSTYEDWYAQRRSQFPKYFKDKERARRSLEADGGVVTVEVELRDPKLLAELIRLKSAQYVRSGLHDIFACGWTVRMLEALMASPYPDFGASMCVLKAGDRIAALEYSLAGGRCYHFWFPAYYAELARNSPGILLSMETIRQLSMQGFTDFDYGCGSDGYKRYFCERQQMVGEARILRKGLRAGSKRIISQGLRLLGKDRAQRFEDRVRRRWNVIEACEVTLAGRLKGIGSAVQAALNKRD